MIAYYLSLSIHIVVMNRTLGSYYDILYQSDIEIEDIWGHYLFIPENHYMMQI